MTKTKVKLSPETLTILKNFADINQNIVFKKGNVITTVKQTKAIIAWATVAETFEHDFAIADLRSFLATLSMFDSPELDIDDKTVSITEGDRRVSYTLSDVRHVMTVDQEAISQMNALIDKDGIEFKIPNDVFAATKKALLVLNLPQFEVVGDGETIVLKATDASNKSSHAYSVKVGETDKTFKGLFRSENLQFLQHDYTVKYTPKGFARFSSDSVSYIVGIEVKKR